MTAISDAPVNGPDPALVASQSSQSSLSRPKASIRGKTIADKLREAKALIERGWTQDANARGKSGRPVDTFGAAAICFCAGGALLRANGYAPQKLRSIFENAIDDDSIEDWNDKGGRTQAEVIAAFDKAIELAEAQS